MGIVVYSLLWEMQDVDHQPYHVFLTFSSHVLGQAASTRHVAFEAVNPTPSRHLILSRV